MKKYEIKSISGHQTSKIIALVWASVSLVFILFGIIMVLFDGSTENSGAAIFTFVILPIFYLILGYLFTRLICFIYNKLRPKFGGIEIEIEESRPENI